MADSSLVGVIVGGLIVLCTQLLLDHRRQSYEKQKELRQQEYERQKETRREKKEKLEELITSLYDHEYWVYSMPKTVQFGKDDLFTALSKLPQPPISKMRAISNIYFPEFQEHLHAFSKSAAALIRLMVSNGQIAFDRSNSSFVQHAEAIVRLENFIRDYAKREFQ
jgi:hypothetical protein